MRTLFYSRCWVLLSLLCCYMDNRDIQGASPSSALDTPPISIHPTSINVVAPGGSTTLTAKSLNGEALSWQWRFNGSPLPGETNPTLTVYHQIQNTGDYDVVLNNALGRFLSAPVPLKVSPEWQDSIVMRLQLDPTGKIKDLTQKSNPSLSKGLPLKITEGPTGIEQAWQFEPKSAHIVISSNAVTNSLADPQQGTGLSLAFWVRMPAERPKIGKIGAQLQSDAHLLGLDPLIYLVENANGGLYCELGAHYYASFFQFESPSLADGQWHHIAYCVDMRTWEGAAYIDGQRQIPNASRPTLYQGPNRRFMESLPYRKTSDLHIGADAKGRRPWQGAMADVTFVARALKPAEVESLFKQPSSGKGYIPTCSPTVQILPFRNVTLPSSSDNITVNLQATGTSTKGALSYKWINMSDRDIPKGAIQIVSPQQSSSNVTFNGPGKYRLACQVTDGQKQSDLDKVTFEVYKNLAPSLGGPQVSSLTKNPDGTFTGTITATILDDGLPNPPAFVTTLWTQLEGPASANIHSPRSSSSNIQLPKALGQYRFQIKADDGDCSTTGTVIVDTAVFGESAMTAQASIHKLDLNKSSSTTLIGNVEGDKIPKTTWIQLDGPATANIAEPSNLKTLVSFTKVGQYRFALTRSNSKTQAITWVNVWMPGAIDVFAGSSRVTWLPDSNLVLQGTTSASPKARHTWSKVYGLGEVHFSNAQQLKTNATFSKAGIYSLKLTVEEGKNIGSDLMVVEVHPEEQNFGYSAQELLRFKDDTGITRDTRDLDWSRLAPPPPAGVHPRIMFGPDDVPELRQRMSTGSSVGKFSMDALRKQAETLQKNPLYSRIFNALIEGDTRPCEEERAPLNPLVELMKLEAFRILIDEDQPAGVRLGAAMATLAERARLRIPNQRNNIETRIKLKLDTSPEWRLSSDIVHTDSLAWCYDFIYNYMTPSQRNSVRSMLAEGLKGNVPLGSSSLPGLYSSCSNWIPLTAQSWLYCALAIEGEEGSSPEYPLTYAAICSRSCFGQALPDGSTVEGGGKGWIGIQSFFALAKRGYMDIASLSLKNYMKKYLLHIMEPHGYGFTFEEMNGGSDRSVNFIDDVLVMKFAYPKDPEIDFVYRNSFSKNKEDVSGRYTPYRGGPVLSAICAVDVSSSLTWEKALQNDIKKSQPLTNLFDNRGLLVTRSSWDPEALRLFFQPRSIRGGHMQADRNALVLNGLGRVWLPMFVYQSGSGHVAGDSSQSANMVRVDDLPSQTAPARMVDFLDQPLFTCATGDASDAYRTAGPIDKNTPREFLTATYNQLHLQKLKQGWADLPDSNLPDWQRSRRGANPSPIGRPDAKAFRTTAMVRGQIPYVLVADDLRMDQAVHNFKWRSMVSTDLRGRGKLSGHDIIYTDADGQRALLVRLLSSAPNPRLSYDNKYQYFDVPWIDLEVDAVSPAFRVLLMPFKVGTPLPVTRWEGNDLLVEHSHGGKDRITFASQPEGWTKMIPVGIDQKK